MIVQSMYQRFREQGGSPSLLLLHENTFTCGGFYVRDNPQMPHWLMHRNRGQAHSYNLECNLL